MISFQGLVIGDQSGDVLNQFLSGGVSLSVHSFSSLELGLAKPM
jgi:hypothetical protein